MRTLNINRLLRSCVRSWRISAPTLKSIIVELAIMHEAILQLKWTTQASRQAWCAAHHARRSGTAGTPSVDIFDLGL